MLLAQANIALFQSTPVIADGRIPLIRACFIVATTFQSTPVIADGRIGQFQHVTVKIISVSIHARHC